jgi:hypothetical protein
LSAETRRRIWWTAFLNNVPVPADGKLIDVSPCSVLKCACCSTSLYLAGLAMIMNRILCSVLDPSTSVLSLCDKNCLLCVKCAELPSNMSSGAYLCLNCNPRAPAVGLGASEPPVLGKRGHEHVEMEEVDAPKEFDMMDALDMMENPQAEYQCPAPLMVGNDYLTTVKMNRELFHQTFPVFARLATLHEIHVTTPKDQRHVHEKFTFTVMIEPRARTLNLQALFPNALWKPLDECHITACFMKIDTDRHQDHLHIEKIQFYFLTPEDAQAARAVLNVYRRKTLVINSKNGGQGLRWIPTDPFSGVALPNEPPYFKLPFFYEGSLRTPLCCLRTAASLSCL